MSTIASTLLDFILGLFQDPAKAAAYAEDPRAALDEAGLDDVTPEEVADLMPMVADFSTVGNWGGAAGGSCADPAARSLTRPADDGDDADGDDAPSAVQTVSRGSQDGDEPTSPAVGGASAPPPAGGTETVLITRLQEVEYTHTETTIEIDASHSIWVSGDAQAIFGDVRGDLTQVDNDGIIAGDDVEDSTVDNSDRSVSDSGNTTVDVDLDGSPVNLGRDQAVDSFYQDNDLDNDQDNDQDNDGLDVDSAEDSFNGNGSGNEDNDVTADRGGQVGDDTTVRVDDVNLNTGDGTLVNDATDSGNSTTTTTTTTTELDVEVEDVTVVDAGGDAIVGSEVAGSQNEDNDGRDVDVTDSFDDNDLSDDDTTTTTTTTTSTDVDVTRTSFEDSFTSDDDGLDDSLNGNAVAVDDSGAETGDLDAG